MKTIQIAYNGKLVDGMVVEVVDSIKPWADFILEDGSKIRINVVVSTVCRVEGVYDDQGHPVYVVGSRNVLDVDSADDLRRKTL